MFDGLMNRLGFSNNNEDEDIFDEEYDAYSDNFDDFSTLDEEEQGSYSPYSPVTTRAAGTNRSRRSSYSDRTPAADRRRSGSHPPLVSYEDVRNSTAIPESLNRDPLPERHRSSAVPAGSAARGVDSLYDSPAGEPARVSPSAGASVRTGESYDPYRAYEGVGSPSHKPTRNVIVLQPVAYDEVEHVARNLRAGDAVILSLRNTPSQLSKRILDFSFGVASALDATVDCIADKVFAITRVTALTDAELGRLRGQGVI